MHTTATVTSVVIAILLVQNQYNFFRYLKTRHILQPAPGRTLSYPRCHSISPVRLHLMKLIARHREIRSRSATKQQAVALFSLKSSPQRNWHHLARRALLLLRQQTCNTDMFGSSQEAVSDWCLVCFFARWIHVMLVPAGLWLCWTTAARQPPLMVS